MGAHVMVLAHQYMHHSTAVNLSIWCTLGAITALLLGGWLTTRLPVEGSEAYGCIFLLGGIGLLIAGVVGIVNLFIS
jgi:hypothetical protein